MSTEDGRFTMVFNGEIYNYQELKTELEGAGETFRGTSDTEVLLRLYEREGVVCLKRLDGMFALAVHDAADHTIFLARDPLGEKPLYFVESRDGFVFASEVRALLASGGCKPEPDWRALGLFLRQGSIPAPFTHIKGVSLLPAGSWIKFHMDGSPSQTGRHWDLVMVPESEAVRDRCEAVARVGAVLRASVRRRMRADVPVAAFLSGGLDSAAVVTLMKEAGAADLRTFTVQLPGHPSDEARSAEGVACWLGTRHMTVSMQESNMDDWLEEAFGAMDVPSVDGANTWLVSRAVARAGIKVVVSGLGGDELFYGYPSFRMVPGWARTLAAIGAPRVIRGAARMLRAPTHIWPRAGRLLDSVVAGGSLQSAWLAKRGLFSAGAVRGLLRKDLVADALEIDAIDRLDGLGVPTDVAVRRKVLFLETSVYLRDQLLRDSDTMSMAHSLELRVPLIGHEVVDTLASISDEVLGFGEPKALLREAVGGALPPSAGRGPKMGFSLDWPILLPRGGPWRSLESDFFLPGSAKRIWELFFRGRIGFAYPFALEVIARKLDGMV